jgi:hypothetical protein
MTYNYDISGDDLYFQGRFGGFRTHSSHERRQLGTKLKVTISAGIGVTARLRWGGGPDDRGVPAGQQA